MTDRRSAQIARDLREGTFPEKSPMTLLEDHIEALEADLKLCTDRLEENTDLMNTATARIEALEYESVAFVKMVGERDARIKALEAALREIDRIACGNKGDRQTEFDQIRKCIAEGFAGSNCEIGPRRAQ